MDTSPLETDKILVHLDGRWPGRPRRTPSFAALVVEVDGRRHRFPELVAPQKGSLVRRTAWGASFALPAWLGPHLAGSAALVVGEDTIPLSAAEELDAPPTPSAPRPAAQPARKRPEPVSDATPNEPAVNEPRGGESPSTESRAVESRAVESPSGAPPAVERPAAEESASKPAASDAVLTGEDAVFALRAELDARASSEAQLRGRLADTQSQLDARSATQERLESAHAELRQELEGLRERVARGEEERARALSEMRAEITATVVSRDAALSEATALRGELERLTGELAQAREQAGLRDAGVDEAERLLAEARALSASLRSD